MSPDLSGPSVRREELETLKLHAYLISNVITMHAAKLNLKIAFTFSLFYSLWPLIYKLIYMYDFSLGSTDYMYAALNISVPVFIISFPLILAWSHKRYFEKTEEPSFRDVVIISLLIIFMSYSLSYLIDLSAYKFYFEKRLPPPATGQGIIDLMDPVRPRVPSFSPLYTLIILPFKILPGAILSGNLVVILSMLPFEKILYLLLILYIESLFFLFKRHHQNPWFSIVPFLNKWILLKIVHKPAWWNFMIYIPIVRYFFLYSVNVRLAADAGKPRTYAVGMTLLPSIFYGHLYLNDGHLRTES